MAIAIKEASKSFGDKAVLDRFSLEFPVSGTVALLGPSGCGKTTLLRLVAGLERPEGGLVNVPKNVKIAYLFQEDRLLPALTAKGNIMAALNHYERASGVLAGQWLARVGLAGEEDSYPDKLSGGMKRRVAIARALAFGGNVLLLDEPFKGLDANSRADMLDLTLMGHDARARLNILVTHDVDEALAVADKILLLEGPPLKIKDTVSVDIPVSERERSADILVWHREYIRRKLGTGKKAVQ